MSALSNVADQVGWAVIYFAGHSLMVDGKNYLVPVDASLKADRSVALQAICLDQIMGAINGAKKLRLVFLDACRDDPFLKQMSFTSAKRNAPRRLARVEPETGTVVAYAARDGAVVFEIENMFDHQAGPTLRHRMAHGLLHQWVFGGRDAIYACWFIYRLCIGQLAPHADEVRHRLRSLT